MPLIALHTIHLPKKPSGVEVVKPGQKFEAPSADDEKWLIANGHARKGASSEPSSFEPPAAVKDGEKKASSGKNAAGKNAAGKDEDDLVS